MQWYDACAECDIPVDRGWPVVVAGIPLAVFRDGPALRAVDNVCRHLGFPIDDGCVQNGYLTCPWHGWCYDLATGHLRGGAPAKQDGLRTYRTRVRSGRVEIALRTPAPCAGDDTPGDARFPPGAAALPARSHRGRSG